MLRTVLIASSRNISTSLRFSSSKSSAATGGGVYKSPLSFDKVYPSSNQDYLSKPKFQAERYVQSGSVSSSDKELFTGYIPMEELKFSYSCSSGAGGQHVNKVATKVEIRFHVDSATWIPDWIKPRFLHQERNKISKDGYYITTSDKTRKQLMNQADALEKIRFAVRQAATMNSEPTEQDLEVLKKRESRTKEHNLKDKRIHSLKKQRRLKPSVGNI